MYSPVPAFGEEEDTGVFPDTGTAPGNDRDGILLPRVVRLRLSGDDGCGSRTDDRRRCRTGEAPEKVKVIVANFLPQKGHFSDTMPPPDCFMELGEAIGAREGDEGAATAEDRPQVQKLLALTPTSPDDSITDDGSHGSL